jgi:hypothetical protein
MSILRTLLLTAALLSAAAPATAQTVDFAGYSWVVRTYPGGPGPNEWREQNVRVDENGLHLTIQQVDGIWSAAEIFMLGEPLGFGSYEFEILGDLSNLDRNVVLGLFNYPGSAEVGPDGTNEIDIEFSQWGDRKNPDRLNWNVYPAVEGAAKGHHALPLDLRGDSSTHRFTWSADRIDYESFDGIAAGAEMMPIGAWSYTPENPTAEIPQKPLVVHVNLWLVEGKAPSDGKPVEVTLRNFRYTPQ